MGVKNGFREFYEVWKKRDLLRELFEDAADVLSEGERMYSAACNALLHGKQPEFDLEEIDQEINEAKSKIREKVVEHMMLNPRKDMSGWSEYWHSTGLSWPATPWPPRRPASGPRRQPRHRFAETQPAHQDDHRQYK